jgi:CheY-like chemotaxis protein
MKKIAKDISVLVVEDEPTLNAAYIRILESGKMQAQASFNGEEALAKLEEMDPDIILLDLKMPKMSGLEFLATFGKMKPQRKAKVIIFSNYDKQTEIQEAFKLGAAKYLLKAWASPKELISVIEETVNANA